MTLVELATAINDMPELEDLERQALPVLVSLAVGALRVGLRPTFEDLASSRLEYEAWMAAGVQLEVERAQRRALADQGPHGAALAQADVDGGEAADELLVESAAETLAKVLR